jgi:hypothetical protein
MIRLIHMVFCVACGAVVAARAADAPIAPTGAGGNRPLVHLFVLAGHSNMVGVDPDVSFTPTLTNAFPHDTVMVVKSASHGHSIASWFRLPSRTRPAEGDAALYARLMMEVRVAVSRAKPDTVTFVWMQGEGDTRAGMAADYGTCLTGLVSNLRADFDREDVNVVIGRINDAGVSADARPDWNRIRETQVAFAKADPYGAWVDTDDLNGPKNSATCTHDGYVKLGQRFAEAAIALIRRR